MTQPKVGAQLTETTAEAQRRLNLLPKELERAVARARRRTFGAGRDRAFRQMKRITGEGKQYWLPNRVYAGPSRLTGAGRVWTGLNPSRTKQGKLQRFPALPKDFDAGVIKEVMTEVFEAELEKAARDVLSGRL